MCYDIIVTYTYSGKDPEKLNRHLEDAIRKVCYLKEKAIISAMSAYRSRRESRDSLITLGLVITRQLSTFYFQFIVLIATYTVYPAHSSLYTPVHCRS